MSASRDSLDSRMSATSSGASMLLGGQYGNNMELVRQLYTILEPQLCKSYRTNVKYTPTAHPVDYQQHLLQPTHFDKRKNKVKTARIVIEAVNQFQTKGERPSSKAKPTLEPGKLGTKEKSGVKLDGSKESSQSLPNLTIN